MMSEYTWSRDGGYECSTAGDKRYSALYATLEDGRTIECHYQCDVKGYEPGGTNWRLGKGKPALDSTKDLWAEYLSLWVRWSKLNPAKLENLRIVSAARGYLLSDTFAATEISQARALAYILNETEVRPLDGFFI